MLLTSIRRTTLAAAAVLAALALAPFDAHAQVASTIASTGTAMNATATCSGGILTINQITTTSGRNSTMEPFTISQTDCSGGTRMNFAYGYSGI
ncbi:MAG TPA: hypothetical protein VHB21_08115, partial [Minicystis sp.]|nr:hypothetical protein [Minicystis sp.]